MTMLDNLRDPGERSFPYEVELGGNQRALIYDVRPSVNDPARQWVVNGLTALAEWLKTNVPGGYQGPFSAILIEDDLVPADMRPLIEALGASLQVMINSIAMEYPNTQLTTLRVNTAGEESLDATLEYLATEAGSYVTASTIDLRGTR